MTGAASVDGHMAAWAGRTPGRNHRRGRGNIRSRESDVHLAAVPTRTAAVRRHGTSVQDIARLDDDLPAGRAVGVKLSAIDEPARRSQGYGAAPDGPCYRYV